MPHILIANDDGIHAPGLRALVDALAGLGTLSIVAPHIERSGTAQSITLRQPIAVEQIAENEWAIEGTPTDGVILALHKLLPSPPDLIVSGINRGANMGENVYYSGTLGAAMEGVINGIPAMAISLMCRMPECRYEHAARFARRVVELVLKEGLPRDVLLNINVPNEWSGGVRFARQSRKITRTLLREGFDATGRPCFWLQEQPVSEADPETDYAACFAGDIAVTPLVLDRTDTASLNNLSRWIEQLEERR